MFDVEKLGIEFSASNYSYPSGEHAKLSLRTWSSVVYGKMTAIDRSVLNTDMRG